MAIVRKILRVTLKVIGVVFILILIAMVPFGLILSHDSACEAAPALAAGATPMKAIVRRCYGSADVVHVEDVQKPMPDDNQVLIKVHAAAVNPLDWHYVSGKPYLMRLDSGVGKPEAVRLGVDFAGTVEAVGKNVKKFQPGDAVFGGRNGAFGEYVTVREDRALTLKPANISFEQAASVPVAAVTALQALRDKGHIKAGQNVLINGASGGVGTFAVQIAKSFGAEVTGVCSTRNLDLVRKIGADHVIDYTKEDFTDGNAHYDLIIDTVSTHSLLAYRHVLNPNGIVVIVGGPVDNWLTGLLGTAISSLMWSPFVNQKFGMMLAELNPADLAFLADLMQSGKLIPVIDRTYSLNETPDAIRYLEQGHARGKVVITLVADAKP